MKYEACLLFIVFMSFFDMRFIEKFYFQDDRITILAPSDSLHSPPLEDVSNSRSSALLKSHSGDLKSTTIDGVKPYLDILGCHLGHFSAHWNS